MRTWTCLGADSSDGCGWEMGHSSITMNQAVWMRKQDSAVLCLQITSLSGKTPFTVKTDRACEMDVLWRVLVDLREE